MTRAHGVALVKSVAVNGVRSFLPNKTKLFDFTAGSSIFISQ